MGIRISCSKSIISLPMHDNSVPKRLLQCLSTCSRRIWCCESSVLGDDMHMRCALPSKCFRSRLPAAVHQAQQDSKAHLSSCTALLPDRPRLSTLTGACHSTAAIISESPPARSIHLPHRVPFPKPHQTSEQDGTAHASPQDRPRQGCCRTHFTSHTKPLRHGSGLRRRCCRRLQGTCQVSTCRPAIRQSSLRIPVTGFRHPCCSRYDK